MNRSQTLILCTVATLVCLCSATAMSQDTSLAVLEQLLDTKVEVANKYARTVREIPASVSIISGEEIAAYGYSTIIEALDRLVGFYSNYDRNYSYLGARGFGRPTDYNNRFLLLVNGFPINEAYCGQAYVGTEAGIPLMSVDRIEVIRGPGSVLYGTGAMFAVVNIITKSVKQQDGALVRTNLGSAGTKGAAFSFGSLLLNKYPAYVAFDWGDVSGRNIYYPQFNALSTNYGVAENLDWDRYHSAFGTLAVKRLSVQAWYSHRTKAVPTAAWGVDFNSESTTEDWQAHLMLQYVIPLKSNLNATIRGYASRFIYRGLFPYAGESTWDQDWTATYRSEALLVWDVLPSLRVLLGTDYTNHARAEYKLWDNYDVYFHQDHPYNLGSGYTQLEWNPSPSWVVNVGLRKDESSREGGSSTPRMGVAYHLSDNTSLKFLLGSAFRNPSIYEATYEDPIYGNKSNPALAAEKIETSELVWEQQWSPNLSMTTSAFRYQMRDLIDQFLDPVDSLLQFQNSTEVDAIGLESELRLAISSRASSYFSYSFAEARERSSDSILTNSPQHMVKAGLVIPTTHHASVATEFRYESSRLTKLRAETGSHMLCNLNVSIAPRLDPNTNLGALLKRMTLHLQIKNLFDESYGAPAGNEHVQDIIEQDGRSFLLRLKVTL